MTQQTQIVPPLSRISISYPGAAPLAREWQLDCLSEGQQPKRWYDSPQKQHRKVITPKYVADSFAALLATCSQKQKIVYLARRVARMSWREIGTSMRISHVQAQRLYYKALKQSAGVLDRAKR